MTRVVRRAAALALTGAVLAWIVPAHVLAEVFCIAVIITGCVLLCAAWSALWVDGMVARALADEDRGAVESAYQAGGWDEHCATAGATPIHDDLTREFVTLALHELEMDLDREDGLR